MNRKNSTTDLRRNHAETNSQKETKAETQEFQDWQKRPENLPSAIRILRHNIAHELDKLERLVSKSGE